MARALEIPLSINPTKLIRGLRVTEDHLEDVTDAVEDIGDEADKTEDAFRDLSRSAQRDFDRVERAAKDAEDDVSDVADEAADSAKEFGSAFRGDPVEALEEIQSLIAEVVRSTVKGFGGIALSLAGGVAFSALISFYEKWREEQEARLEQVREWRDAVIDAFGVLDKETFSEAFTEALDEAGVTAQEFEALLEALPENLRVGLRQAIQSGDLNALETVLGDIETGAENIRDLIADGFTVQSDQQQAFLDLSDLFGGPDGIVSDLNDAVGQAQALARILGNDVVTAAGQAAEATGQVGVGRNVPAGVAPIGIP